MNEEFYLCDGRGCPYKLHCWRFLAPRNEVSIYFDEPPFKTWNLLPNQTDSSVAKGFYCEQLMNPLNVKPTLTEGH